MTAPDDAFEALPGPMQDALELAWDSAQAGSFGVGAVIVDAEGNTVATGRNRLFEREAGDDVLAGSSLAHAELNALAKLRYLGHADDGLHLYTSLQPCLQCTGAIRLTQIERVTALADDPLWPGLTGDMRDLSEFTASKWAEYETMPASEWAAFALLWPTMFVLERDHLRQRWQQRAPQLVRLVDRLIVANWFTDARHLALVDAAATVWGDLLPVMDELELP